MNSNMPPHRPEDNALTRSLRIYQWLLTIGQVKQWQQLTQKQRANLPLRSSTLSDARDAIERHPLPDAIQRARTLLDLNQNDGALTEAELTAFRAVVQAQENLQSACRAAWEVFKF